MNVKPTDYDYIVVGAGSAGAALAARLSEPAYISVLLIEAGGKDRDPLIHLPMGCKVLLDNRRHNWDFENGPEPGLPDQKTIRLPRGRVLGGSSSINGMVFVRGHPRDFDEWRQLGCAGWSHADVLPYFKRLETYEGGADSCRGGSGPLHVRKQRSANPLYDAFMLAGRQMGLPETADYNGVQAEGFCRTQHNQTFERGHRCSTAVAYLRPARGRANLHVLTDAQALGLVIEKGRAVGVRILEQGQARVVRCAREVIVAAGAYQSPHLLMLSGIGPADHLRQHGIAVEADVAGVGANLQDHIGPMVQHECLEPVTYFRQRRSLGLARALIEGWFFGSGILSHLPVDAMAFLRTLPELERPDLKIGLQPILMGPGALRGMDREVYCINWVQLRPESRGHVRLRSADPLVAPFIQHNYLTAPEDMACHRQALRLVRDIHAQAAFDRYRGPEIDPGSGCRSDADIDAYIRRMARVQYHPVGTCKMGGAGDAMAVLDPQLRVLGIEGLRVADASVMPRLVGANTNAPSIMIGEKAADLILGRGVQDRADVPARDVA
ncbi:MAG: choline dehydrogenase [Proteobacteria bacterium]|nr:choline dehydrogenase [Pseudomonadota bacterium]